MRIVFSKSRGVFAAAFTLVEVMVAVVVSAIAFMALYAGTFQSFAMIKATRENLQATQLLVDKLEIVRLATWEQLSNPAVFPRESTSTLGSLGLTFKTTMEVADITSGSSFSALSYRDDLRMVTLRIFWTNDVGLRSNEMTTLVARYGLQRYIK